MYKKFIKLPIECKFFYSFMLRYKKYILVFFILGIFSMIFDIYEPLLAKNLIDVALYNPNILKLKSIGLIWILIFLVKYIMKLISQKVKLKFKVKTLNNLQMSIFEHVLKLPLQYFKNNSTGYIMSRQVEDTEGLEGLMLYNLVEGILSWIQFLIIFIIMIKINYILSIISMIIIILDISLNFMFPLKKLYKEHTEAKSILNKELQDVLIGIKVVKTSDCINYEINRFKYTVENYYLKKYKRDNIDIARGTLSKFVEELNSPLVIIIGGIFVYKKILTFGEVMAFILYFQRLNTVFASAINMIPLFKISLASAERIYEILKIDEETIAETLPNSKNIKIKNSIEFKNINFNYGKTNVLNNLNMIIYPNKINAIVGTSGSGKSTIVDLLLRFLKEDSGKILIDNKNINLYDINILRRSIAVLHQDSFLFNRTLIENLSYNKNNNKPDETLINYSLKKAFAKDIVSNLPKKLDTIIGERGNIVSGGEKQRLCIARELIKDSDIFIFDEATSALDSISEEMIKNTIFELAKKKTIITIAHRLSTIKEADIIYVLNKGSIEEMGTHKDLINKKGLYYSLYLKQQDNQNI